MIGDREEFVRNYGGISNNDLNEIFKCLDEEEPQEILHFPQSSYVNIEELAEYLKSLHEDICGFSLNKVLTQNTMNCCFWSIY